MKITSIAFLATILTLAITLQATQSAPVFVNLSVTKNEKAVAQPLQMTFMLGKYPAQVPIQGGRFEVPQEIVAAVSTAEVQIFAVVGQDQLRFSVDAGVFRHEIWALRLADRRFDDATQSLIPKGESPRSFCVLEFSDKHSEVSALLIPNCRTSSKK
jgi:hypothetical protein